MSLLLLAILIVGCSNTKGYKSSKELSMSEYEPGSNYSPGSTIYTDDDEEYNTTFDAMETKIKRELTKEVKQRIDVLLADFLGKDEEKIDDAESRLVDMGDAITDYLATQFDEENQLKILSLINKIKLESVDTMGNTDEDSISEDDDNADEGSPNLEVPKPDERLNDDILEKLHQEMIDPVEIQKFYRLKLQELQRTYDSNDFKKAAEIAKALIALFPEQKNTVKYLKHMQKKIEDALQSSGILQGKVSADSDSYEFGDKIKFRFLLRNVSSSILKILFSNEVSRAKTTYSKYYSPCIIHFTFTQWSGKASRSTKHSIPYRIEGEVELQPGQVWQHIWEYDTSGASEHESLGAIKISADIRPLRTLENDNPISIKMIKLSPVEVIIYPKGYKELSEGDNVIENLQEAIKNGESVRIVIAASAVGNNEKIKWEANKILIDALKSAKLEIRLGIFKALRALNGFDLAYDESYWREWYEYNKPK
ncbi:MAG: hypothetical protein K8S87_09415 [Planctomycetes bacterium]|nr:hypothetical protein [Planctomycetota bacterium]